MTALIIIAIIVALATLWILFTAHDVVIGPLDEPQAYDDEHLARRARDENDHD